MEKIMHIPKKTISKLRTLTTFSSESGETLKKHITLKKKDETLQWLFMFKKRAPKTIDITVTLAAYGARANIGFAWHGTKKMESDITLIVSHEAQKTESCVALRAVLEGAAKIRFRGLARVAKHATSSRAYLSAKALMLSPRARAFLKPDLEVATSEAIAWHGSSVGRPSDKEMFYFASRGIAKAHTKKMMRDAFMKDIADQIPVIQSK